MMYRTRLGFAMKLVGANSEAARLAGISVNGIVLTAMICSGALCGLAGGIELCGRIGFIPEGYSPGYGYQAIAVALLGRLSPIGVFFAALFIGALSVGCRNMERTAGIDFQVGYIIQAVALLALLATQWPGWSTILKKPAKSTQS
jgi:simple sugar transport system permease protein